MKVVIVILAGILTLVHIADTVGHYGDDTNPYE